MQLSVRPLAIEDLDGFIDYWTNLSQEEIERMGVATERVPAPIRMRADLEAAIGAGDKGVDSFVLVWCVDGKAIGHSSLKDILPSDFGRIHLHIWRSDLRGKGYGPRLFCLAALDFYKRFNLKRMICEPKADNPMPNRMLQKIGFPLLVRRVGTSSELSKMCELNCYDITRDIAEQYMQTHSSFS
jgi:RimJ/RimL family protein N-acetyltransferase